MSDAMSDSLKRNEDKEDTYDSYVRAIAFKIGLKELETPNRNTNKMLSSSPVTCACCMYVSYVYAHSASLLPRNVAKMQIAFCFFK